VSSYIKFVIRARVSQSDSVRSLGEKSHSGRLLYQERICASWNIRIVCIGSDRSIGSGSHPGLAAAGHQTALRFMDPGECRERPFMQQKYGRGEDGRLPPYGLLNGLLAS
jgi:hypothetical protein